MTGKVSINFNEVIGLEWEFNFGKYKGETVEAVLHDDPGYIVWCCDYTEKLDNLDPNILRLAQIKKDEENE